MVSPATTSDSTDGCGDPEELPDLPGAWLAGVWDEVFHRLDDRQLRFIADQVRRSRTTLPRTLRRGIDAETLKRAWRTTPFDTAGRVLGYVVCAGALAGLVQRRSGPDSDLTLRSAAGVASQLSRRVGPELTGLVLATLSERTRPAPACGIYATVAACSPYGQLAVDPWLFDTDLLADAQAVVDDLHADVSSADVSATELAHHRLHHLVEGDPPVWCEPTVAALVDGQLAQVAVRLRVARDTIGTIRSSLPDWAGFAADGQHDRWWGRCLTERIVPVTQAAARYGILPPLDTLPDDPVDALLECEPDLAQTPAALLGRLAEQTEAHGPYATVAKGLLVDAASELDQLDVAELPGRAGRVARLLAAAAGSHPLRDAHLGAVLADAADDVDGDLLDLATVAPDAHDLAAVALAVAAGTLTLDPDDSADDLDRLRRYDRLPLPAPDDPGTADDPVDLGEGRGPAAEPEPAPPPAPPTTRTAPLTVGDGPDERTADDLEADQARQAALHHLCDALDADRLAPAEVIAGALADQVGHGLDRALALLAVARTLDGSHERTDTWRTHIAALTVADDACRQLDVTFDASRARRTATLATILGALHAPYASLPLVEWARTHTGDGQPATTALLDALTVACQQGVTAGPDLTVDRTTKRRERAVLDAAVACRTLLADGPARTVSYHDATDVWRAWLAPERDHGHLGRFLTIAADDRRTQAAKVAAELATLDRDALEAWIDDTDRALRDRTRRVHDDKIVAGARETLLRWAADALDTVSAWCAAVQAADVPHDYRRQAASTLAEVLTAQHDELLSELAGACTARPLEQALARLLHRTVTALVDQVRTGRVRAICPRAADEPDATATLLATGTIPLGSDLTAAADDVIAAAGDLLAEPDWAKAYQKRAGRDPDAVLDALIDAVDDPEIAETLLERYTTRR